MQYQAFHKPGEYPPSPPFDSVEECKAWLDKECIDGHNKNLPCEGALLEWTIEESQLAHSV